MLERTDAVVLVNMLVDMCRNKESDIIKRNSVMVFDKILIW